MFESSNEQVRENVASSLAPFVGNPLFSDLSLVSAEGTRIPAHKFLLCARSQHFRAMLTSGTFPLVDHDALNCPLTSCGSGMRESSAEEIPLPDLSEAVVKALLQVRFYLNLPLSAAKRMI